MPSDSGQRGHPGSGDGTPPAFGVPRRDERTGFPGRVEGTHGTGAAGRAGSWGRPGGVTTATLWRQPGSAPASELPSPDERAYARGAQEQHAHTVDDRDHRTDDRYGGEHGHDDGHAWHDDPHEQGVRHDDAREAHDEARHEHSGSDGNHQQGAKYDEKGGYGNEDDKSKDDKANDGDKKGDKDEKSDDDKEKEKEDEEKRRKRRPWVIAGGALAALVLVVGGVWWWLATRGKESTDDAYTDGTSVTIAPKVAGYVVELLVSDNSRVKAGDLMLRIDPRDYAAARDQAQAGLEVAQAQLANAQANLDLAKTTFPARLRQAEAQRQQAQAQQQKAASDLARQRAVDPRATTQQDIDAAVANFRVASATTGQQSANVEINRPVPLNIALAETQVKQAEAQVSQARAQLETALLNLSYTELRAPQDGWVTKRNVYLGNYLTAGQSLFSLVSPYVWVTANFKENQLDRMRPGQPVRLRVDAYPHLRLRGHVDSIQMGSGSRFSAFPAENATGNFIKIVQRVPVKLVIDEGMDPNLPLPLGLSVVPTVEVDK